VLVGCEDDFGVAVGEETPSFVSQLGSELGVVVDLTVRDDRAGAVLGKNWLAAGQEVDDRQAPESKATRTVFQIAGVIRSAMRERMRHPAQCAAIDGLRVAVVEDAADAAHGRDRAAGIESRPTIADSLTHARAWCSISVPSRKR
jgi:hypothetical protein